MLVTKFATMILTKATREAQLNAQDLTSVRLLAQKYYAHSKMF
jgi:hypothetical protein